MPIEEVVLEPGDNISLGCKRLKREEFWYKELCTVFPYGLNDSVKGVGNVSKKWIRNWWCTHCLIGQKGSFERESRREKGGEEWLRMLSMK